MSDIVHDLKKEAAAAASLLGSLRTTLGDDDDLKQTVIEGETNLYESAEQVIQRLVTIKAMLAGIAAVSDDLEVRKTRLKSQEEMLRSALLRALEACGQSKLELPVATIYTKKGTDSLGTYDEAILASKYFRTPDPVVDKKLLLDDLKSGEKVEGASLKNGAPTVSIRYK